MDLTGVITIGFVAAVLGWMIYSQLAAGKAIGKSAQKLREKIPELESTEKALVYCYSPNCPPCRNMTPHIDDLAKETGKVFKLDITRNMELAQAMGIRATPTTLVLDGGEVRKVLVGVKPRKLLEEALATDG